MVHSPYTPFFADAFMASHAAIGLLLAVLAWSSFPRSIASRVLWLSAIALIVTAPLLGDFMIAFGGKTPALQTEAHALLLSSLVIAGAFLWVRRFVLTVVGLVVSWLLFKMPDWSPGSMTEICALHAIWTGVALGLVRRRIDVVPASGHTPARDAQDRTRDLVIFVAAMLIAALTSIFVLQRADGSADEWAYTWQAAVFAKGHIYGSVPPCETAFQNFYVFESVGRMFVQYTPGWPYFMAPFVALGVPWLAAPASHGMLAVGVARVARRAVRLDGHGTATRARAAGWIAAAVSTLGTTILLNGASRYSHVFVAALYAWAIEAVLVLCERGLSDTQKLRWGILLGSFVGLLGATRPADGATLSFGLAVYYLYVLIRGRIGLRAFVGTVLGFVFVGGLTLVVLRVQLGEWWTTGYSLDKIIHPWAATKYSWPHATEWKSAMPLATGSYSWFPCSLAIGLAGVVSLRQRASGIIVMLVVGFACFDAYYQCLDLGHGYDWGYGPRYMLPFVVLMAVGTGVALAPLAENASRLIHPRGVLYAGGPFAVAVVTIVVTLVRLWPLLYPGIYAHVHQHDSLNQRIRDMDIHHAVVLAELGTTGFDARDLTENLPLDLYPNQDVLVAFAATSESGRCIRTNFPDRAIFRAYGNPVVITPQ